MDKQRVAKQRFAVTIAQTLTSARERGDVGSIILAAPPRMVGDIRAGLDSATRSRVVHEIQKDLTHLSPHDLVRHLASSLWTSPASPI